MYCPQHFYLAVTDASWFDFHQKRQSLEVNFWKPSSAPFKSLIPGQNLLFKIKMPFNHVVGGGTFVGFEQNTLSEAWRLYGEMNGHSHFHTFRKSLMGMNRSVTYKNSDPLIGCIILEACHFYDQSDWVPCPQSFKRQIVSGRRYGVHDAEQELNIQFEHRRALWMQEQAKKLSFEDPLRDNLLTWMTPPSQKRFGEDYLMRPRLGQGAFRRVVLESYNRQCAITREHTLPVLEAVHIKPYHQGGGHSLANALLLRSDFHTLFDRGYLTITPEYRLEVSQKIRSHFNNGVRYEERHGLRIHLPTQNQYRPNPSLLEWHNENVFLS